MKTSRLRSMSLKLSVALLGSLFLSGLFFGIASAQGPLVDLGNQEEDVRVIGVTSEDWMGEVTASGDVNGDGYDDLIVSATGVDYAGRANAGAVYIILGRPNLDPTWQIGTSPVNLTFYGAAENDLLGHSVGSGDVNGDGVDDILIGADRANDNNGAVYVFLGSTDINTSTQQIIDLDTQVVLPCMIVRGSGAERLGRSIHAEDINDDGYQDLIVGAYYSSPGDRLLAGAAYVILGGNHLTSTNTLVIDLATENAAMTILGAAAGDYTGRSVSSGDVNGDNYGDVIIGVPRAGVGRVGQAYIITGSASITTSSPITYDLSTITDTAKVSTYYGTNTGDETGFYVASGDVNDDSYDDVLVTAYRADAYWDDSETGQAYVVYGQASLSNTVYLSTEADITIYGAEDDERLGRSIVSGDVTNDGYDDIVIGASWADRDGITDTGRVYIIAGGTNLSPTINLSDTNSSLVRIQGDDGVPPGYQWIDGRWYGDELGRAVATGDINNDGAQDVIAGALWAENAAGEVYVIYGGGPITLDLSPTDQTISSGHSITYTVTASNTANLRDVSAKTTFSIENGAGGSWDSNVYTASIVGTWTVTATYQGVVTTTLLTVTNQAPIANANGPYNGAEGSAITLSGNGSNDPEGAPLTYQWDWDDDGNYDAITTAESITHTWTDDGAYTVTLLVVDTGNLTDTDSVAVNVDNVAPIITSLTNDSPVGEGSPVTISVSADDPGDDTLTYAYDWNQDNDFDDPDEDANTYTWIDQGIHTITVQVDDGDGGVVTDTTTITVNDINPTADFIASPTSGDEPLSVQFTDTSTSYDGIIAWSWDLDGDSLIDSTAPNPPFTYTTPGAYTVTLTVQEVDGDSDTRTRVRYIAVGDVGPTADFVADVTSGDEPLVVHFTDTSTSYGGVSVWDWDLDGDGSTDSAEPNPSFTYIASGVYSVTLTVQEADGDSDAKTQTHYITVNNVPPTANAGGPYWGTAGSSITLSAAGSTDPSPADTLTYEWDWDNDGLWDDTTTAVTITHTWNVAATYTVTLRVTDGDGGEHSATTTVTISPNGLNHVEIAPGQAVKTAGQSISYTLTAYDAYDNTWDVTASGSFTAPLDAGGAWTANVYTTEIAGDWTITATYGGQSATATLRVDAGALDHVVIQDTGGGQGNAIITRTMTSSETLYAWAAGYDTNDNYIGDISVNWTGTGVVAGLVSPASGISTTFTAGPAGTGTIIADDGNGHTDSTETITVRSDSPDTPAKFMIELPESGQAGQAFPATITAQDAEGNTLNSFNGVLNLSTTTGGDISPNQVTLQNGVWTGMITLTAAGEAQDVVVTDPNGPGTGSATINLQGYQIFLPAIHKESHPFLQHSKRSDT